MEFVIIILRYILLLILYLFIFRVILLIIRDIRDRRIISATHPADAPVVYDDHRDSFLLIVNSDVPALAIGAKISLATENYIGRSAENRIQIPDDFTSHHHARLTLNQGQFWLEDLGSKNGTYIAGVKLDKPTLLNNGDLFSIGGVTFKLERWANEV